MPDIIFSCLGCLFPFVQDAFTLERSRRDAAVSHPVNPVAFLNGVQAVCNDDHRLLAVEGVDGLHQCSFCVVVQCGSGLIEDQNFRVVVERPGNADALALAAGEADTAVADLGIKALRKSADEFIQLRFLQHLPEAFLTDLVCIDAEGDVLADGFVNKIDALRNVADLGQPGIVVGENIGTVTEDRAFFRMQQPEQDVYNGGFACAGGTHDADRLSAEDLHIGVPEDIGIAVRVVEGDIFQFNTIFQMKSRTGNLRTESVHLAFGLVGLCQVVVEVVQAGLFIGNLRHVGVDPVGTGQNADGGNGKGGQLCQEQGNITAQQHVDGNEAHDADHEDGLDHEARQIVEYSIVGGNVGTDLAALIVVADKEILTVQNLDILEPIDGLQSPFGNARLDVLIAGADGDQARLDAFGAEQGQRQENDDDKKCHLPVDEQQEDSKEQRNNDLCGHLQKAEDQGEGLRNIAVCNSEDRGNVGSQIVFVGTVEKVTHDAADHIIARIGDKMILLPCHEEQERIFDNINGHEQDQHRNGETEGGCQTKTVGKPSQERDFVQIAFESFGRGNRRNDRKDHGNTDSFQNTADQDHDTEPEALALLTVIQNIGQFAEHGQLCSFFAGSLFIKGTHNIVLRLFSYGIIATIITHRIVHIGVTFAWRCGDTITKLLTACLPAMGAEMFALGHTADCVSTKMSFCHSVNEDMQMGVLSAASPEVVRVVYESGYRVMKRQESGQNRRSGKRQEYRYEGGSRQEMDETEQDYVRDPAAEERRRRQRQARRLKRERELRRQMRILITLCSLGVALVIAGAAAGVYWLHGRSSQESLSAAATDAADAVNGDTDTENTDTNTSADSSEDTQQDSGQTAQTAYCTFTETANTVQLGDSLTDISIYDAQRGIASTEDAAASDSDSENAESSESAEEGNSSEEESSDTSTEEAAKAADYVDSQYAILVNATTGEILAERRAFEKMVPASMTKVMTLLVTVEAMENQEENLKDTVTITQEICDESYLSGSSFVGYGVGDTATVEDLLYGAILPSGADAAMALAEYTAGSQEAFAEMMNQKAEELGISETTHFTNCVGLYDEDHYSTVYDMCVIMKAAVDNELCRKILSTHTWTTGALKDNPNGVEISNWFLRRIEDHDTGGTVLCGKTGFVNESGNCAVSYEQGDDGNDYIVCTGLTYNLWRCIYDHVALYKEYT